MAFAFPSSPFHASARQFHDQQAAKNVFKEIPKYLLWRSLMVFQYHASLFISERSFEVALQIAIIWLPLRHAIYSINVLTQARPTRMLRPQISSTS